MKKNNVFDIVYDGSIKTSELVKRGNYDWSNI